MKTLAEGYPGDHVVLAGLEMLGMIAVLVLVVWAAELTLARRRPALADSLWVAALVGVLMTPLLVLVGPRLPWRLAMLPTDLSIEANAVIAPGRGTTPNGNAHATESNVPAPVSERLDAPIHEPSATVDPPRSDAKTTLLAPKFAATEPLPPDIDSRHVAFTAAMLIWGLGSFWLTLRWLHGVCRLRRLRRSVYPLNSEIQHGEWSEVVRLLPAGRLPELAVSEEVRGPVVVGLTRPCVVFPEALLIKSTPEQLRDILLHEWAHIVRRDAWIHLLQQVTHILFWVHPLIHLLQRRLSDARERVCDNYVLAHAEAPDYAGTLLSIAQFCYPNPHLEGHLAMMPRRHNLERRVVELLDERRDRATRLSLLHHWAIAAGLALILTGIASVGFHAAIAQEQQDTAKKSLVDENTGPEIKAITGKISGRVVNFTDGQPVKGAEVRLLKRGTYIGELPTRQTAADERGEFTFDSVAPGAYRVWSFHGDLTSRSLAFKGDIVEVAADGAVRPVTLHLKQGIAVRVTVVGEKDNKPIAGARIRLLWSYTDPEYITDGKGQVELRALTPETWNITATAKDHATVSTALNLATAPTTTLEMKLPPGGVLEGRVVGGNGEPVAGAGVGVSFTGPERRWTNTDSFKAKADGTYRIEHVPLGSSLTVEASKLDYIAVSREFRIEPGEIRSARIDLTIKKRPHGGSIKGIVTDTKGQPIAGAELSNHGAWSVEVRRTKTDAQGKFLLEDVYTSSSLDALIVKAKGYAPRRLDIKPGPAEKPTEMSIRLEAGHRIKGRAVNEAGQPIVGARVYFAEGNTGSGMNFGGSIETDAQGRFAFDSLPAGTPFTFTAKNYTQIATLQLPLDGDDEVVVTLKSPGAIKGRVVDKTTGKPAPRFNVRINFSSDRQPNEPTGVLLTARLDPGEDFIAPDGQFELKDLIPGMPLQVSVTAPGYRRQVLRRIVAQPWPEAESVDIELAPEDPAKYRTVNGRLLDHKGQPVVGAEVRVIVAINRGPQRNSFPFNWEMIMSNQVAQAPDVLQVRRLSTKADGSFLFDDLPGDGEIELIYWGKGIPAERIDHMERMKAADRAALIVKAMPPARLTGGIDRQAFPEIERIYLSSASHFWTAELSADGKTFTVDDLPPGDYEVQIYGRSIRSPKNDNSFQPTVLGRHNITIEQGKSVRVELGAADKVKMNEQP